MSEQKHQATMTMPGSTSEGHVDHACTDNLPRLSELQQEPQATTR